MLHDNDHPIVPRRIRNADHVLADSEVYRVRPITNRIVGRHEWR
jgi:hypothetical protein